MTAERVPRVFTCERLGSNYTRQVTAEDHKSAALLFVQTEDRLAPESRIFVQDPDGVQAWFEVNYTLTEL